MAEERRRHELEQKLAGELAMVPRASSKASKRWWESYERELRKRKTGRKKISWIKWDTVLTKNSQCLFYEWNQEPGLCLAV
ncbi:hypothetical protein P8452_00001 [Trifolium repens]|nr:hypothetical protein P8452_00001 [Trifolium repens]